MALKSGGRGARSWMSAARHRALTLGSSEGQRLSGTTDADRNPYRSAFIGSRNFVFKEGSRVRYVRKAATK